MYVVDGSVGDDTVAFTAWRNGQMIQTVAASISGRIPADALAATASAPAERYSFYRSVFAEHMFRTPYSGDPKFSTLSRTPHAHGECGRLMANIFGNLTGREYNEKNKFRTRFDNGEWTLSGTHGT